MSPALAATFIVAVFLLQVSTAKCSPDSDQSPSTGTTPTPAPSGETFQTQDGVRFGVEVVVNNLEVPWDLAFAPDGRLFVTERPGRVRIIDLQARSSAVALTLDDVFAQGEAGALGLALDPEFAQTRFVYVYYTATESGRTMNRVARYREVGGRLGERAILLDNIPASTIHDGGRIRFGPDGLLYFTAGDAANSSLAQDVASLAGKIMRVNRDGTTARGNAFSSPVYSWGHRNPQGLDWHPVTGDLWATEHGNTANDEVNVVQSGANYGWPRIEAAQTMTGMETPVTFYNPTVAPSGAAFYRGQRFPQFVNNLFVGTLRGTHIIRLRLDASSPRRIAAQERLLADRFGRIRVVVSGPDGFLYFATNNRDGRGSPTSDDDRIARLVPVN